MSYLRFASKVRPAVDVEGPPDPPGPCKELLLDPGFENTTSYPWFGHDGSGYIGSPFSAAWVQQRTTGSQEIWDSSTANPIPLSGSRHARRQGGVTPGASAALIYASSMDSSMPDTVGGGPGVRVPTAEVRPGYRIRCRGWGYLHEETVSNMFGVEGHFYDENGDYLTGSEAYVLSTDVGVWTLAELVLTVPDDAAFISFGIGATSTVPTFAKTWDFDNASCLECESIDNFPQDGYFHGSTLEP